MSSPKALLQGVVGRFLFREAIVSRADALGPRFRRLVLAGPALRGVSWTPGDKLQVFLPGVGTRAYTPVRWDSEAGETELLAYLHGEGPGSQWARSVQPGAAIQVFGPRSSLVVGGAAPTVVFGDETSLGLAWANGVARQVVAEVSDLAETQAVLETLGFSAAKLVQRQAGEGHREALANAVLEVLQSHSGARLVLSGRASAIQGVRQALKARGVDLADIRAKAYWAPGKTGLD